MNGRIVIAHGLNAGPHSNWFPAVAQSLEAKGYNVSVPALPVAWAPNLNRWAQQIAKSVEKPSRYVHLIGHSTGSLAIMRYLEGLRDDETVGTVVLVSAFPKALFHPNIPNIFARPPKPTLIRGRYRGLLAVHTENDWKVPLVNGDWLNSQLGATVINLGKRGHIDAKSGVTDWPPELYEQVLEVLT